MNHLTPAQRVERRILADRQPQGSAPVRLDRVLIGADCSGTMLAAGSPEDFAANRCPLFDMKRAIQDLGLLGRARILGF
jgi:hypothetical protein